MRLSRPAPLLLLSSLLLVSPARGEEPAWTRIGPEGGQITAYLAVPARPATLYAGFIDGGIYRSDDRGATWRFAGKGSGRLRIAGLAAEAGSTQVLYAASGTLGVAKTTDGGSSWKAAAKGIPLGDQLPVVAVATDAKVIGTAYAAARVGSLYKTVDGGKNWKKLGGSPVDVMALASDPRVAGTLYAVTVSGKLWKTTNAGGSWRRADGGLPADIAITRLLIDPKSSAALLVLGYDSESGHVLRSGNGGKTWVPVSTGELRSLAMDPADPKILYLGRNDSIERSLDGGKTWQPTAATPPGSQFQLFATRGAVIAQPFGAGLFRTTDRGGSWPRMRGIRALSARHIAVAPGPRLYTRVLDGSSVELRSDDRGKSWQAVEPLDDKPFRSFGALFELDPSSPATIYAGFAEALAQSLDGGDHFEAIAGPPCILPAELAIDPADGRNLYLTGDPRSSSGCPTQQAEVCATFRKLGDGEWECIEDGLPGLGVPIAFVDPFASGSLYAHFPGALFRSADYGTTWELTALINFLTSLAPDPTRPGVLYSGVIGHTGRSDDHGETWDFTSAGLPANEYVMQVVVDPSNGDRIYAGTSSEVYRSDDAGRTWRRAGLGLSESVLLEIALDPDDPSVVYAATFGGGLLRLDQP